MVNASSAYARGATGAGITIGITDSGLDNSHVEISATRLSQDSALITQITHQIQDKKDMELW